MTHADRIANLRVRVAEGLQLTPEAEQQLVEAAERDEVRAAAQAEAREDALLEHKKALADYANIEAGHRKLMQKIIDSTTALSAAYERADAAARGCRRHGDATQGPTRIHTSQAYESRCLVRDFHTAARSPV